MKAIVREASWTGIETPRILARRLDERLRSMPGVPSARLLQANGLLALGAFVGSLCVHDFYSKIFLLFFSILLASASVAGGFARAQGTSEAAEEDVRTEFGEDGGWVVSLSIRQGDAVTGVDSGLLWFEDGKLYFAGRYTSFGLLPGQVVGKPCFRDRPFGTRNTIEFDLDRVSTAGRTRLSLRLLLPPRQVDREEDGGRAFGAMFPWERNEHVDFAHRCALKAELDAWAVQKREGRGQYPPATLGPGIVSERRLFLEASSITLAGAAIVTLFGNLISSADARSLTLFGAYLFVAVVPASNLRWRALRDRRRLRRAR